MGSNVLDTATDTPTGEQVDRLARCMALSLAKQHLRGGSGDSCNPENILSYRQLLRLKEGVTRLKNRDGGEVSAKCGPLCAVPAAEFTDLANKRRPARRLNWKG